MLSLPTDNAAARMRANSGSARLLTGVHAEEPVEPLFDRSAEKEAAA